MFSNLKDLYPAHMSPPLLLNWLCQINEIKIKIHIHFTLHLRLDFLVVLSLDLRITYLSLHATRYTHVSDLDKIITVKRDQ